MREAAWVVLLAVVVVFVVLVALEVGRRSEYRSPVERVADLFTRSNVRNVNATTPPSSLVTNATMGGGDMGGAEMGADLDLAS
jgi:hypothetical protein